MSSHCRALRAWAAKFAALPNAALVLILFVAVAVSHLSLLRLPYYWDEGGYYIPAALDFYHRYTLIPAFTNAHPPLPNIVLGLLWHVFGLHIIVTRLVVSLAAAMGLLAVFRLANALAGAEVALATLLLTAIYPIWFAQSTLAHADIFAAAFTLAALALYIPAQSRDGRTVSELQRETMVTILFSLAALSKETAILQPATLAAFHLVRSMSGSDAVARRQKDLRWLVSLSFPVLPLACWYTFHRWKTGFTFGNPEYLRYNATANFTLAHFFTALRIRFVHLVWQRNIWFPLVLAAVCLLAAKKGDRKNLGLPATASQIVGVLVIANWIAFSVLGGALLTRYLLPIYPLILLACIAVWRAHTIRWRALVALTVAAFLVALWWSPPAAYAPEDNLTYRDMIVVHQQAIAFIDQQYPDARVLTSWPAAAELYRPELGYTDHSIIAPEIDDFSSEAIDKAAQEQDKFDTALIFSKNFTPPALSRYLLAHPDTKRGREYARRRDLTPREVASRLRGEVVFYREAGGEWAAVLRFPRRYNASL